MWFIKRVIVDEWDIDTALEEATALGMNPESPTRAFALEYIAAQTG